MTKATKSTADKPKRVKVTLACVVCRKKKVKCDGVQPCCSRCESMGLSCEFSDPPRKRGPPKNHVEVIENRAHRIESLLGKDTRSSSNYVSSSVSPTSRHSLSKSPSPPASPPLSYQLASTNALLNLVTGAVEALKGKWKADCMLTGGPMTSLANDTLPQRFKLQLAEKYFANFNLFLPLLSRHHFLHRLVHQPDEMDPLLCYAVCAMGSRYLEHRDDLERLYFERCLLLFEKLKSDEPTLPSVQGVIIMCWYTFMMGDFKKCACLRRHLVNYVRQLNLGMNADPSLSIVQTEQRRRTFWVIYVTDAWLSFYTDARLINMTKEGWNCKKPILEDSQMQAIDSRNLKWEIEQPPQILQNETTEAALQMPSFVELIQLASIVGDMFDCLQSRDRPAQHLESQLTDWFLHLPSYLEFGKPDVDNSPAPIAKTIRILYHTVQIILHQSPLLDSDQYTRNSICTSAADSIIHIAGQMLQQQDELKLYNTFTMSITLAASVHLERVMTQPDNDVNCKARLGRSIRVLKDANCSYLTKVDFDRLVDRFLTNRCGLVLDDGFKSTHQLAGMWQILQRSRQSLAHDQQHHLSTNHHLQGNTTSSIYSKSPGHMEPIILSESVLPHPPNIHNLDIDGLLNDSMTELIFGGSGGAGGTDSDAFHSISAQWAAHANDHYQHTSLTAHSVPANSDLSHSEGTLGNNTEAPGSTSLSAANETVASPPVSSKNVFLLRHHHHHYQQQQQQQQRQQQQQQQEQQQESDPPSHQLHSSNSYQPPLTEHLQSNEAIENGIQDMDSSGSSASPPSCYSPAHSPEQDNRIRLLPATTLLPSVNQHITPQQGSRHSSDNLPLSSAFII